MACALISLSFIKNVCSFIFLFFSFTLLALSMLSNSLAQACWMLCAWPLWNLLGDFSAQGVSLILISIGPLKKSSLIILECLTFFFPAECQIDFDLRSSCWADFWLSLVLLYSATQKWNSLSLMLLVASAMNLSLAFLSWMLPSQPEMYSDSISSYLSSIFPLAKSSSNSLRLLRCCLFLSVLAFVSVLRGYTLQMSMLSFLCWERGGLSSRLRRWFFLSPSVRLIFASLFFLRRQVEMESSCSCRRRSSKALILSFILAISLESWVRRGALSSRLS